MNLIERYERHLEKRVRSGAISEHSRKQYWDSAAKVLEAAVGLIPVSVLLTLMEEWGPLSDYDRVAARDLLKLARGRSNKDGWWKRRSSRRDVR